MVRAGVDPPAGLGVSGDRDLHPFGVAAGLVGGRGVREAKRRADFRLRLTNALAGWSSCSSGIRVGDFPHPEPHQTASGAGADRLPNFLMCRALLSPNLMIERYSAGREGEVTTITERSFRLRPLNKNKSLATRQTNRCPAPRPRSQRLSDTAVCQQNSLACEKRCPKISCAARAPRRRRVFPPGARRW
jgi:hypothetical protein